MRKLQKMDATGKGKELLLLTQVLSPLTLLYPGVIDEHSSQLTVWDSGVWHRTRHLAVTFNTCCGWPPLAVWHQTVWSHLTEHKQTVISMGMSTTTM